MTEEEYNEKVRELDRLIDEYNRLVAENEMLEQEIETGIENCYIVADNISTVAAPVTGNVKILAENLDVTKGVVDDLQACLIDITQKYFLFKNLSDASKNLTQYNDVYFRKFYFYNELRRITLGYVIGIDSHIVSSETLRKKVEKAYLANTDYWLAYAISAVMLWASNEKEAAYRALNKSIVMDYYKTCIFFMLVNIRFNRLNTTRNWFITLLDKTDVNNIKEDWQHVLRLYLSGILKADDELNGIINKYFEKMFEQITATNVEFTKKVTDRAYNYASAFIHKTEADFISMSSFCPDYGEMKEIYNETEKISVLTKFYDDIYNMEDDKADNLNEQVENILYDLINSYDDEEFKVIKEIKRNEAVMAAKGDITAANKKFNEMYGQLDQTYTFGDLMIQWAFSEDYKATDITVKRFAISRFKEYIKKGFTDYFRSSYEKLKDTYNVVISVPQGIPPLSIKCDENQLESSSDKIKQHYEKNKMKFIMADKYIKIFLLMCGGALLLIAIAALAIKTSAFPVFLTLGIVLGIVSGFLVWRRCVDVKNTLQEMCRSSIVKLRSVLDEMGEWRKQIRKKFSELEDIEKIIDKF